LSGAAGIATSNKASVQSHNCTLPQASAVDREKLNLSVPWGCLVLADRGYFDRDYLLELTEAGASFVIRVRKVQSKGAGGLIGKANGYDSSVANRTAPS
ncbi:MAG: transposase, partial [Beggiatoa sp.]|nr:transposase [Beggiatoa sp.]